MITDDEKFIKIQGILAMSDVHPTDCIKINDLIIELSKETQQLKDENKDLREKVILLQASEPMVELTKYYGDRDLYKSAIDEIRKYIKTRKELYEKCNIMDLYKELKPVLEIIDKVKGESNE